MINRQRLFFATLTFNVWVLCLSCLESLACQPGIKQTHFINHNTGNTLPINTLLIFADPRGGEMESRNLLDKNLKTIPVKPVTPKFNYHITNIKDYAFYKPGHPFEKNQLYAFFYKDEKEQKILAQLKAIGTQPDFDEREHFRTGDTKARFPTELFRPMKHRQKFESMGMCGLKEEHIFIPDKEIKYSLYLMKIYDGKKSEYYLKTPEENEIVFRRHSTFDIERYFPFKHLKKYRVWIAPVTTAGQVGKFSGECSFYSKPVPVWLALEQLYQEKKLLFILAGFGIMIFVIRMIIKNRKKITRSRST